MTIELAEVWCRKCPEPATPGPGALCDVHRAAVRRGLGCAEDCECNRPTDPNGEPHGAADDPYGRPSSRTHPEYWTE